MKKAILILTLFVSFSCSEDPLNSKNLKASKNTDVLKFQNSAEIFSFVNDEVDNARAANDEFESFDEVYKTAITELDSAQTIESHSSLLEAYSDVLILSDSTYIPKINNYLYRKICNRDRIYEADGYAHKVLDDSFIVSTEAENAETLKHINSMDNLDPTIYSVRRYQDFDFDQGGSKVSANCGNSLQDVYFDNNGKCSDDRRVYIRAYSYYVISGNSYTAAVISEAWGTIRNWLCNWKHYETIIRTRNCSFDVHISINQIDDDYSFYFDDYSGNAEVYERILINGPISLPISWSGGAVPMIYFSRIHEEATSRGVGYTNWAIIECQ